MILETLTLMGKQSDAFALLKIISEELNLKRWYSTQTTSYALLAVGKFVGGNKISKEMSFEYSIAGKNSKKIISTKPIIQEAVTLPFNIESGITVKNNFSYPLFARIILEGKPITGDQTDASNKLSLSVGYYLMVKKSIRQVWNREQILSLRLQSLTRECGKIGMNRWSFIKFSRQVGR